MLLLQNLLTALEQVWANKLRSVLTVLGVIIAVTSTLVGVVFGLLPAFKAAILQPIDALRYE